MLRGTELVVICRDRIKIQGTFADYETLAGFGHEDHPWVLKDAKIDDGEVLPRVKVNRNQIICFYETKIPDLSKK